MRKRTRLIWIALMLLVSVALPIHSGQAASKPTYTISPDSKPYQKIMMKYSTYNAHTKHYYLMRSYLEQLEKKGGGTLILKKGTYTISNALYVPSNVTIVMKNGVKLVKGKETGTKQFIAAKSMFQLIRPSKAAMKGVYGEHEGEKNISLIGEGKVTIDMKYIMDSISIIMGHNQNVKIENIKFKNMHSGHFIEMDASDNVMVRGNTFMNSKASEKVNKEAINLDTPDKSTQGWSQLWSTFDKTANQNVTIENNTFKNLDRAVGTHKYSESKYHDKVTMQDNTIENTRSDAIRVMNWSNAQIRNNIIKNVENGKKDTRGVLVSGAINPTITDNTFQRVGRAVQLMAWKNTGPGSQYAVTYNELNQQNKLDLMNNVAKDAAEPFIRINYQYNEFILSTERIYLVNE